MCVKSGSQLFSVSEIAPTLRSRVTPQTSQQISSQWQAINFCRWRIANVFFPACDVFEPTVSLNRSEARGSDSGLPDFSWYKTPKFTQIWIFGLKTNHPTVSALLNFASLRFFRHKWIRSRVTRLGEFSPNEWSFRYFGQFCKNYRNS
jgi:hypothetical protein